MEILPQLLVNSLIAGSIYALASSGLSLTYGLLRILNFAHGHLMMLGVYFFYFVSVQAGLGLVSSALLTALFALFVAVLTLHLFVFPFSKFSFLLVLISTMALSHMLEAIVSMVFGVNVKSLSHGDIGESIVIGSVYITPIQIVIIVSALLILGAVAGLIHHTPLGRRIRALSEHRYAAQALGISERRMAYLIMVLGTLIAVYAGVMVGYETNMQPTMGTNYTIKAFAAMILGGFGHLWGTIVGSYILGLVENLSIGLDFFGYSLPAGYKDAFAFAIILLVLLFRPQGLFRRKERVV